MCDELSSFEFKRKIYDEHKINIYQFTCFKLKFLQSSSHHQEHFCSHVQKILTENEIQKSYVCLSLSACQRKVHNVLTGVACLSQF